MPGGKQLVPEVTRLDVKLSDQLVGVLAEAPDGIVTFEYDPSWLRNGYSISPYSLPLQSGLFIPEWSPFDGLFGVFNDSLPDGWGRLLVDRMLRQNDIDADDVSQLTRLALVGPNGKGALEYEPSFALENSAGELSLDELALLTRDILSDRPVDNLDAAFAAGGSSGGARPKAYVETDDGPWLVKFPSSSDSADIGQIEYEYALCAGRCGIEMAQTRLFPSRLCAGYFGSRRFDRDEHGNKVHLASASGLLEVSHRFPLLDYEHVFKLAYGLTHDMGQLLKAYRLMCFNVFAHNQDDHSNNFSWLCKEGAWELSPAYDLTYSTSFGNEHATTVQGKGDPSIADVVALGVAVGIREKLAREVAKSIERECSKLLHDLGLGQ